VRAKKVVLYIESSSGYGRNLLTGISEYSWQYGPWEFFRPPLHYSHFSGKRLVERMKRWGADGLIVREARAGDEILQLDVPTVLSPNPLISTNFPSVVTDDLGAGRMAAEYFLELGYRNLAFCGYEDIVWSQRRCEAFLERLAGERVKTFVFSPTTILSPERESIEISQWLRSLPSQVGLFACNDDRGTQIIELCRFEEIPVPEQIAVLGVDNDEITCNLCVPQLSSVQLNTVSAGFQTAKLLDDLMSGEKKMESQEILDEATRVVGRASTDSKPINDPYVAEAAWFIRRNIRDKINASDVVKRACISRNSLYSRFRKVLGKSIYEFIQEEKIKYMSRLLSQTDMSVSQIASQLGESDDKNISRIFRKRTGLTPHRFRELSTHDPK